MQKQRIATILALLLLPAVCPAAVRTVSLAGTINKTLNIRMELKIDVGIPLPNAPTLDYTLKISGSYFYEKDKTPISLKGTMDGSGHFEIQEFDAQGKVTGTFRGKDTSIFEKRFWPHVGEGLEGDWTKPGSDKKLPFALQVDPVYHHGKSSGWAGEWNYTKSTQFDSSSITIGNEQPGSFDFTMGGGSGAHPCQLEGTAQISGTKASWTDSETGCKVTITLKAGKLALKTTEQCNGFCGMGAQFYNGEYRHGPVKRKEMDLVDLGVLKKAQQKELQRLSGKDYHLFVNSFQLTSEEEDLDGMGIKGTSGAVRGLFTYMEAIVLYRPDGKIWAAAIDSEDDTVKYFTNDPAYAGKLPKTIDKWRERFADKKVLFMSKTK